MNKNIGTRVRIDPFDHCSLPAEIFPLKGTVDQQLRAEDGADNWYLIMLDQPFEYQRKIGEPYQFVLSSHDNVIIRSRWADHEIGDNTETSVFLLLTRDSGTIQDGVFRVDDCDHVAWAMCKTENTEQ